MPHNQLVPTAFDMFKTPLFNRLYSFDKHMNDWAMEMNQNTLEWARMNYHSTDTEHIYEFTVPGLTKNDVKVSITNHNQLNVKGTYTAEVEDETKGYHHQEFSRRQFSRKVTLPDDAITEKGTIKANVIDGILTVTFGRIVSKKEEKNFTDVVVN